MHEYGKGLARRRWLIEEWLIRENDVTKIKIHFEHVREGGINTLCSVELSTLSCHLYSVC